MEIKKNSKYLLIFLFGSFQFGCASIAHSPYACDSVSEKINIYGWSYKFFGNITQFGDCAISKALKIETGDYYFYHKDKINHEIEMNLNEKEGYELNQFAKAFNCKHESFSKFHSEVIANKSRIFGTNFSESARSVTKSIQKIIDQDMQLSEFCR